jgi:hypothetical protein
VSARPLGTVGGVQLLAVFQSPETGFVFQVALPAKVLLTAENRSSNIATVTGNNGNRRPGHGEGIASDIDGERRMVFSITLSFRITEPLLEDVGADLPAQRPAGSGVGL